MQQPPTQSEQPRKRGKDKVKEPKAAAVKQAKFKYVAETLDGQVVKGQIQSVSANTARNELAVQGLRVTELTERKGLQVELTKEKVPAVDLMHFSRQMATFLRAGVPVTEAIDNLRRDADNKKL